ncbi:MAG TPA: ABC transporter permease [Thermoanaerobaculia bacterium]|jgi:ABC-2 type transport system permease protein
MKKMLVVFKREYLQAVRRKMFIFMTFAFPALMAALMFIPTFLMVRGLGEKHVAVLDGTGQLRDAYLHPVANRPRTDLQRVQQSREVPQAMQFEYVDHVADPKPYLSRMTQQSKDGQLDGVLIVPPDALTNSDAHLKYYSRTATDFISQERLSSMTNHAVQRDRLQARGLDSEVLNRAMTEMTLDSVQLSKTGEEKKGGSANFIVGFVLCALLILPTIVSGLDVMRGIIQEKSDRVVEVLISSVTPAELLIGKILGTAAVGLTQIGVWLVMLFAISTYGAAIISVAGINLSQFIRLQTFIYFPIFFVLAFLTYVCIYAIGGAACNSDREAQQLIAPITMVMFLPWFILVALITNPDSALSTSFSMAPVFGPMTMYVRTLVSDPPPIQIAISIVVSVATIALFLWVTAKIFRVGILSYGKRPTIPELWRWMKVA